MAKNVVRRRTGADISKEMAELQAWLTKEESAVTGLQVRRSDKHKLTPAENAKLDAALAILDCWQLHKTS
jgi:hypothetical protein